MWRVFIQLCSFASSTYYVPGSEPGLEQGRGCEEQCDELIGEKTNDVCLCGRKEHACLSNAAAREDVSFDRELLSKFLRLREKFSSSSSRFIAGESQTVVLRRSLTGGGSTYPRVAQGFDRHP